MTIYWLRTRLIEISKVLGYLVGDMNSFGHFFRTHTFGESHGPALGVVIDGCPAGVIWREEIINCNLQRRRPGQSDIVSARQEIEEFEVLSGVYQNKTLGTPITLIVKNGDAQSQVYLHDNGERKFAPRIGHADDMWLDKFGHVDPRGGGRASGRETLSRVLAGSVAQMFTQQRSPHLRVVSFVHSIGEFVLDERDYEFLQQNGYTPQLWERHPTRMPSEQKNHKAYELLKEAKVQGKSYGGVATVKIFSPPRGLGQPVFAKLKAELAKAFMSVGATSGVEIGAGFEASSQEGSAFHNSKQSEVYGGLRGGIATGETITFRVAFKPTSSVLDVARQGRHDPCIVPRAIPVLEAMTYLVLADQILWQRLDRV